MTADLAAFRARLDEDERVAHEAMDDVTADIARGGFLAGHEPDPNARDVYWTNDLLGGASVVMSPGRVLAEVAAKRAILAAHPAALREGRNGDGDERESIGCDTCLAEDGYPCPTVRALVQSYATHPDHGDTPSDPRDA